MYNLYMDNKINASEIQRKGLKRVYESIDLYNTFMIENTRQKQTLYISRFKNNLGEVIQAIREKEKQLGEIGVKEVKLFGSLATGKATDKSDIDILFSLKDESKLGMLQIMKSIDEIKDVLKNLNNLDIHHHKTIKKAIMDQIQKEGISVL